MSSKAAILEELLGRIKKNRVEMIIERESALQAVPDIEEAASAEVEPEEITFHDSTQELDPIMDVEEITEPLEADFPVEPSMEEAEETYNESRQYAPPAQSITSIVPEEPVAPVYIEEQEEIDTIEETAEITDSTDDPEQYNPVVFDQKPKNIETVANTISDISIKSYSLSAVLDRAFNLGK
ncbi:MAG: hypothetical protein JXR91_15945 [Deltaproteobacteria bacterium]|nr:hypothetical protein [Deltaproteobacteria bacterium]